MKENGSPTDSVKFYDFIFISKVLRRWLGGGEGSSLLGKAPLAIQQQEVSPGEGRGWTQREGVGEV